MTYSYNQEKIIDGIHGTLEVLHAKMSLARECKGVCALHTNTFNEIAMLSQSLTLMAKEASCWTDKNG